jgi:23S rRNA pseudouridine1911/1915/1917 synthase
VPALTLTVPDDSDGLRLDVFLASVLGSHSRTQLQRLIKEEAVHVAGKRAKPNQAVKAGQSIVVEMPEPRDATPEAEALDLPIVYQDADLVVVNKPAGMVVHPAAGHDSGTLVNALLHHVT